jgi:hypothetical protein
VGLGARQLVKLEVSFTGPGDRTPAAVLQEIKAAVAPTKAELLEAAQVLRTSILTATNAGFDYAGRAFAKYSPRRAYLRKAGAPPAAKQREATKRFRRLTGKSAKNHVGYGNRIIGNASERDTWVSRTGRSIGFTNYAGLKAWLGRPRGVVDLTSAFGPHMLQMIIAKLVPNGFRLAIDQPDKAELANIHNNGLGDMPERRFFDVSAPTLQRLGTLIQNRIAARVSKVIETGQPAPDRVAERVL